jgi:simple sugar transport system substrate-binding protein
VDPAPTSAPRRGRPGLRTCQIAVVVKQEGLPWFDDMRVGVHRFAADHGVRAFQLGPETADPVSQVELVDALIDTGIDALVVVPTDPALMDPVLRRARDEGVVTVSHEAPGLESVTYDLEAFDGEAFGVGMMEELAGHMGGRGDYAVIVGLRSMATHMIWADAAVAHQRARYPGMRLVTEPYLEDGNDRLLAYELVRSLLDGDPSLGGILGTAADCSPGAGRAIDDLGLAGRVHKIGLGLPAWSRPYLKSGAIQSIRFWSRADAGYVACRVALEALRSGGVVPGMDLGRPGYERVAVDGRVVQGDAARFANRANIDEF